MTEKQIASATKTIKHNATFFMLPPKDVDSGNNGQKVSRLCEETKGTLLYVWVAAVDEAIYDCKSDCFATGNY